MKLESVALAPDYKQSSQSLMLHICVFNIISTPVFQIEFRNYEFPRILHLFLHIVNINIDNILFPLCFHNPICTINTIESAHKTTENDL